MKRRNADCGKLRRPIKRNKITESMYGSTTVLYMKFLILWAFVITADFMFMFRFEFLWPFWLLLRSVHDSFKYKGLAFSMLFVCIAVTSDLVCLFFIPVHWLLFAASTYVWVQYVWHTDKGICLPTIILWMLFVYLEAGIRWKDSRHLPHLDLCRPFAAHCIGYPVVTLGFGFKSYVGYRMRQRRQREVSKENEFYMQLLQQALPQGESALVEDQQTQMAITTGSSTSPVSALTLTNHAANSLNHVQTTTENKHAPVSSATTSNSLLVPTTVTTSTLAATIAATCSLATSGSTSHAHSITSTAGTSTPNGSVVGHHQLLNQHHLSTSTQQQDHHRNGNTLSGSGFASITSNVATVNGAVVSNAINYAYSYTSTSATASSTASTAAAASSTALSCSPTSFNDDKGYYIQIGSGSSGGGSGSGATANGHIGSGKTNHHHRRGGMEKETNRHKSGSTTNIMTESSNDLHNKQNTNHTNNNNINHKNHNYHQHTNTGENNNTHHHSGHHKDKVDWEQSNHCQPQQSKEKSESTTKASKKNHNFCTTTGQTVPSSGITTNGGLHHLELDDILTTIEPIERVKNRRNRAKKDSSWKDNYSNHHHSSSSVNNVAINHSNGNLNHKDVHHISNKEHQSHHQQHPNHSQNHSEDLLSLSTHNSQTSFSSALSSSSSSSSLLFSTGLSTTGTTSASTATLTVTSSSITIGSAGNGPSLTTSVISHLASKVVAKVCESCLKLEADVKRYRSEISHMKQIENELRQKLETNTIAKSSLQVKQKECDELEKRVHDLISARHTDMSQIQMIERRLTEERRQKQSLDAQLNNEKKARKMAEEKASRPECSAQCKHRKQQMEEEIKKLRIDLNIAEEAKQLAEQHGRKWEQELRMFEAEIRNRDSIQPGTDVLMNALAAMQDKNSTLEKNLSAETRVKLDLFSALGDAKRQLEISESFRRSKEDEVHDLKAKIAQLLAVMPTDSLCLPSCSSTGASSMLRMSDTPPLQTGPGPASPMLSNLNAVQAQQQLSVVARVVASTSAADYVQQALASEYVGGPQQQQQQQASQPSPQQCSGMVSVSVGGSTVLLNGSNVVSNGVVANSSNLDPNASIYTPKSGSNNQNTNNNVSNVVVVGGGGAADV